MKKLLYNTLPIMQCACSLRQSLSHTFSLNIINYAYITIIIKWKFYAWLEPVAVERLRVIIKVSRCVCLRTETLLSSFS